MRYVACGFIVRWRFFFFFKQKTAYEMRISDWSSDVCSSDLRQRLAAMPMVEVPDEVVAWLVKHFTRNIRELEGALNKLLAYAALTGVRVDLALAEDRLAENVRCARPRITIDETQNGRASCRERVCQYG